MKRRGAARLLRRLAPVLLAAIVASLVAAAAAPAKLGLLRVFGSKGGGDRQFALPDGIEVDASGTIWVADRSNNRVLRFANDGTPKPFAPFRRQHGSNAPGRFKVPYDIAVDGVGNLYVADGLNHRIQEFDAAGRFIRMWGRHGGDGTRGKGKGEFDQPRAVEVDPFGNVWVADHENKRVQKFTHDGKFLASFGKDGGRGGVGSRPGEFNSPRGFSMDAAGNVYVADDANHRIQKLSNVGEVLAVWGRDGGGYDAGGHPRFGNGPGEFKLPYGTAIDPRGGMWVADTGNNRVVQMTTDGAFVRNWGAHGGDGTAGRGPLQFDEPYNIATDCVGNVYVTDEENHRVQVIGDRAFGKPVCPPGLTISDAHVDAQHGRVAASCDRACYLVARFTIQRRGGGPALRLESRRAEMLRAGTRKLTVRIPPGTQIKGEVAVRVTASGPPAVHRTASTSATPQ
jgi:DNA-binding beta-propeller fold protein YncE